MLVKEVLWEKNQVVAKIIVCSPPTNSKVPLLKIKSISFIEYGEVELVPI